MNINTCFETTNQYHAIAYYSHLVPIALALFMGIYVLLKTKFSKLSILFFAFTFSFSLWLINDLFLWTSPNYYLIAFFWSWIDYTDVLFFIFGAYFFGALVRGSISRIEKTILILLSIPTLIFTLTGNTVTAFNQPVCEMLNNDWSVYTKVLVEWAVVVMMLVSLFLSWRKSNRTKKTQGLTVLIAMLLFFVAFSVTEYIASYTGIYEINLYGLFVLPVFLAVMVFAVINLKIFNLRYLGTQLLAYVMIIMVASQFLFLQGSTDKTLNIITLGLSILFGFLLLRLAKREEIQRQKIEHLAGELGKKNNELNIANERLKELDVKKTEFVSMASHQLRAPLTAIKGYSSMILEGSFGPIETQAKEAVNRIFESSQRLVVVIEDFLNVTRIELGKMKYDISDFDLNKLVKAITTELTQSAIRRNLKLSYKATENEYLVHADFGKVGQAVQNLIDNAIKYTEPGGKIEVSLTKVEGKTRFIVKDNGVGISKAGMSKLFEKFSRAEDNITVNAIGTGLGLYVAKQIVEAQGGRIWAESEGLGKGSTFFLEL